MKKGLLLLLLIPWLLGAECESGTEEAQPTTTINKIYVPHHMQTYENTCQSITLWMYTEYLASLIGYWQPLPSDTEYAIASYLNDGGNACNEDWTIMDIDTGYINGVNQFLWDYTNTNETDYAKIYWGTSADFMVYDQVCMIDIGEPSIVRIQQATGGLHAVVMDGYERDDSTAEIRKVYANDPSDYNGYSEFTARSWKNISMVWGEEYRYAAKKDLLARKLKPGSKTQAAAKTKTAVRTLTKTPIKTATRTIKKTTTRTPVKTAVRTATPSSK